MGLRFVTAPEALCTTLCGQLTRTRTSVRSCLGSSFVKTILARCFAPMKLTINLSFQSFRFDGILSSGAFNARVNCACRRNHGLQELEINAGPGGAALISTKTSLQLARRTSLFHRGRILAVYYSKLHLTSSVLRRRHRQPVAMRVEDMKRRLSTIVIRYY
jgi:hypothetical protein